MSEAAEAFNDLMRRCRVVAPIPYDFYQLTEWLQLRPHLEDSPEVRAAWSALIDWHAGKANDHMTVLRLRKLTEVAA